MSDDRFPITIRSYDNRRKIKAVSALRAISKHAGLDIGLLEMKSAVETLDIGGLIRLWVKKDDEMLVRHILFASGLSESEGSQTPVFVIG